MSLFKKRETPETPPLKKIVVTLLGGSNSGKTAFFSGISQAFVSNHITLGGSYHLMLKPVCISRGIAKVENNTLEETTEEHTGETAAAAFQLLNSGVATSGNVPAAFGAVNKGTVPAAFSGLAAKSVKPSAGGAATAFRGATTSGGAADAGKDNRQVDELDVHGVDHADSLAKAQKLYDELRNAWSVNASRGFQAGTATTRYVELTFEVVVNSTPKCLLTITDYAGELIDHSNDVPSAMLTMLSRHISQSDAAIVLASARDLSKHIETTYTASESMFEELNTKDELSADRINSLLQYLDVQHFAILLAITQTDSPQVDARVRANNFQRAAHDLETYIYAPTFLRTEDKQWSRGVLPVTAIGNKRDGSPNVDAQNNLLPDATIRQEHIDTAVLFCLYNAILAQEQTLLPQRLHLQKKLIKNAAEKETLRTLEAQCQNLSEIRTAIKSEGKLFAAVYNPKYRLETVAPIGEVQVTH